MTITFVIDKEKLVMDLLKANKNYQEISKEAHVSFSFISKINRKISGITSRNHQKVINPISGFKVVF